MKNKYGWSVGDKGVVVKGNLTANIGDIVTLSVDDGTESPFWTGGTAGYETSALYYYKVRKLTGSEQAYYEEKLAKKVAQPKAIEGYKFKVDSPEQSKRLQKILFKLGYSWEYSGKVVLSLDHTAVYANIQAKHLTFSSNRTYFDKHKYQLVDIDWLTKLA